MRRAMPRRLTAWGKAVSNQETKNSTAAPDMCAIGPSQARDTEREGENEGHCCMGKEKGRKLLVCGGGDEQEGVERKGRSREIGGGARDRGENVRGWSKQEVLEEGGHGHGKAELFREGGKEKTKDQDGADQSEGMAVMRGWQRGDEDPQMIRLLVKVMEPEMVGLVMGMLR
ncbi:hypothetical protein CRG98_040493 [Punica granatum]|uniref:Uncharacterized protein n=1 Tax=Punica granatum TaxID=22663 RepID=A0A2I0I578_PUNGR|nr:hypothetical protein CRG98_040493 [Punica granatum]